MKPTRIVARNKVVPAVNKMEVAARNIERSNESARVPLLDGSYAVERDTTLRLADLMSEVDANQ
jgi:hypothetical protein